eukprot:15349576-Ditylum_brightwellii.AAC.1
MSNTGDIDYKNNLFDYPSLSRIHGKSTTALLITVRNEVRANAQYVNCVLGGGVNGHLGLVCNAMTYNEILGTVPYARPINPGPLNLPHPATQHQIVAAQDIHSKNTRLF